MLVAVEATKTGVMEYHREGDSVYGVAEEYRPWLLIPGTKPSQEHRDHFLIKKPFLQLEGGKYDRLIEYSDWKSFRFARSVAAESGDPILAYGSPAKNYLVRTGKRLFDGGGFEDIHRLVVDIETTGLDPATSEVFMIAMVDNRGNEDVFVGPEAYILKAFRSYVHTIDPDVIEGHNIVAFDMPFIMARCAANGITPAFGRDKREAFIGRPRKMMIGPNERWFAPVYVPGRHVIDTLIQVQKYDSQIMRHESYGLKAVARDLGIAEPNRIELDRSAITQTYAEDPETVETYALQDVRETDRLSRIICPVEFMQCRLVPDSYQGICATGNGEKWNSILISAYLERGRGIPERQIPRPYIGGLVECRKTGVIQRIVKADVESLYPSLMLTRSIRPACDELNVLLPLLQQLKDERIKAKRKMQGATNKTEERYWDGYQQSAKILINSAYGFMGSPAHFGDWKAAEAVTLGGREVITTTVAALEARGCEIVEVDTDGVMFVPPVEVATEGDERDLIAGVSATLPPGIDLAHDGRFEAMLSLKMKNYVLLGYDGKMKMKGASLKSRSAELFGKEFLRDAITLAFRGDLAAVDALYSGLLRRVYLGELGIEALKRRERITEKTHTSSAKARLSAATQGMAVGEFVFVYERYDGTLGLAEDYAGDEDRLYYMRKAHAYFERLGDLYEDWWESNPRPGKRNMHALVGEPEPPKEPRPKKPRAPRPAAKQDAWDFDEVTA